jgi:hypothetical protein
MLLVHGMDHAGLSGPALEIERSREFKHAFRDSTTGEAGFNGEDPEILANREPDARMIAYLQTFGPDGHPPEAETAAFVTAELASRAGPTFAAGQEVRDTCVWIPPNWRTIGGYVVTKDGQPWTIESAVAEYESRHGEIGDPAVRAELAAIRVYVQIEWEIAL